MIVHNVVNVCLWCVTMSLGLVSSPQCVFHQVHPAFCLPALDCWKHLIIVNKNIRNKLNSSMRDFGLHCERNMWRKDKFRVRLCFLPAK